MKRSVSTITGRTVVRAFRSWKSVLPTVMLLAVLVAWPALGQEEAAAEPNTEQTAVEPMAEATAEVRFGLDVDRAARELVGAAETFAPEVEQVYCLTRLQGLSVPTTVTHAWYRDGEAMARVELPVRSTDWRTWSSKRILPAWTGAWEVKVLDGTGKVLASQGFVIE